MNRFFFWFYKQYRYFFFGQNLFLSRKHKEELLEALKNMNPVENFPIPEEFLKLNEKLRKEILKRDPFYYEINAYPVKSAVEVECSIELKRLEALCKKTST